MSMRYPFGGFLTAIYRAELAPNSPSISSTSAGILQATIYFTAPSSGPTPSSYLVVSNPGSLTATGTSSPITVTGLTGGQAYTFTVYAVNSYNNSPGAISSSVTAAAGGTLYVYGQGTNGALGLGNTTNYSSPKQLGSANAWKQVNGGFNNAVAIKPNGTLWSWGNNNFGQLGLGNTTYYSSPKQVGALTNWKSVSAGQYHTIAVKTDGTLWSWGYNANGQLGTGNTTNYSSPKQIGILTNWSTVSAGGVANGYAIKTNGTIWSWGSNFYGQLGTNNTTYYSSPKQVGALTNWSNLSGSLYCVAAIKTDGTLWSWGNNNIGQLGIGNTYYYSSPKQVGSLTNWSSLGTSMPNASGTVVMTAVKTDGTLWAWGDNSYGQVGQGTSGTKFSSPKQVGSLTNWTGQIAVGQITVSAVKTDGTLWTWGYGNYGSLGLGNISSYSSPKQLGALTTWLLTGAGVYARYSSTS